MNRALQFRAYDTIDKKWLFGYDILGGFNLIGEVVLMGELNRVSLERWKDIAIMQFTGLHDKNGTAIFEGDVVVVKGRTRIGNYSTSVIYECQGFKLKDNQTYLNDDKSLLAIIEVIGNIFSNPELLTQ